MTHNSFIVNVYTEVSLNYLKVSKYGLEVNELVLVGNSKNKSKAKNVEKNNGLTKGMEGKDVEHVH